MKALSRIIDFARRGLVPVRKLGEVVPFPSLRQNPQVQGPIEETCADFGHVFVFRRHDDSEGLFSIPPPEGPGGRGGGVGTRHPLEAPEEAASLVPDGSRTAGAEKSCTGNRKPIQTPRDDMERACREAISRIVSDEIRKPGSSAKILAFKVKAAPRTIEYIASGDNLPSLPLAIMLAREIPALRGEVRRWLDLSSDLDPEAESLLHQIVTVLTRGKK